LKYFDSNSSQGKLYKRIRDYYRNTLEEKIDSVRLNELRMLQEEIEKIRLFFFIYRR
jgi:hypothetical protein